MFSIRSVEYTFSDSIRFVGIRFVSIRLVNVSDLCLRISQRICNQMQKSFNPLIIDPSGID
jgi:hypothetical protein